MANNLWTNDVKPAKMGNILICPLCNNPLIGPMSSTMPDNSVVRKTCCPSCTYVYQIESGYRTAHEANPKVFG